MSFFSELKRRNVFRMGIAYIVVAWVLLQAIDFTLDIISAPNWVMQVFFLAAVACMPVVLIVSWVFELTPEGIKRESKIERNQSITHNTGHKLDRTIMIFLALAVVLLLADRFYISEHPSTTADLSVEPAEVSAPANNIQTIAVLPFVNMSSDPEQEYFSDGLAEELLNRLSKNDRLQVAARTSSFQFKGQNQDISEIGRRLNVAHVLEGSVRKAGNRLRITAQLIQVESGFHLWSETYERELDDVFAIQDDISAAIVRALEVELGTTADNSSSQPTDNLEAYQIYLQARFLLAKRGGENMLAAVNLFEKAIEMDPGFGKAWSGMAFTYSLLPSYTAKLPINTAISGTLDAANKAIHLDPENAEAYTALGRIQGHHLLELQQARANFQRAIQLAPNEAGIVNLYGDFLTLIGDFQKAEEVELRAIELDPLTAVHYHDMALLLLILSRYDEALEFGRTAVRLATDSADRHEALVAPLSATGAYKEATQLIAWVEKELPVNPGIVNDWWCMIYADQNDRENLRRKVDERLQLADQNDYYSFNAITAYYLLMLEGIDAAMPFLEKAHEKNEFLLTWPSLFYLPERVSSDPAWLEFWQQPGLAELIEIRREYGPYNQVGIWKELSAE